MTNTVPNMATNGQLESKTGRKPDLTALNNIGQNKCIWNPMTQEFVNAAQHYKLKRNDIHLDELSRNSWITSFNGKMQDDHWIDVTNARINAIDDKPTFELAPDSADSLVAAKYDPDGSHRELVNENINLKNALDMANHKISELEEVNISYSGDLQSICEKAHHIQNAVFLIKDLATFKEDEGVPF